MWKKRSLAFGLTRRLIGETGLLEVKTLFFYDSYTFHMILVIIVSTKEMDDEIVKCVVYNIVEYRVEVMMKVVVWYGCSTVRCENTRRKFAEI